MSLAVLELNDHELGLYDQSGLIVSSPGYVLAQGKHTVFGQQAAVQSRLHPVSTNNEFWYRLGMNPLARPLAHFRHHADIAHGHLMHLAQQSGYEGEVVLSVPGSFSREQLAVLSGVIRHSPFKPVAMMDAALSSLLALPALSRVIYADVQLHQLSLSRLVVRDGQVRRDAFTVVPGAGWTHLANAIVQAVTDAFIAQSRFNPQHSAHWEQHLYNALPEWLQQFQAGEQEVLVQIQTDKNLVQARVSLSDVLEALAPAFHKITQQVEQFVQSDADAGACDTVLSARAALIPGLQDCLQASVHSLSGEQLAMLCLQALPDTLTRAGDAIPLLTALTRPQTRAAATVLPDNPPQAPLPTHVLWQGQAWPLPVSVCRDAVGKLHISRHSDEANACLRITSDQHQVRVWALQPGITVAGRPVEGSQPVYAGDGIGVSSVQAELYCIKVLN